jgi:putative aminopeptidase FrvX
MTPDDMFELIRELVMCQAPSGVEDEIDRLLMTRFSALGLQVSRDAAGNIVAEIPGRHDSETLAITAHKDEIGAIVTAVENDGRVRVRKLGGAFPWVYGEGVVDLLGDSAQISGILCFGSRHVSHASPQFAHKDAAPLRWEDAWIETKRSCEELAQAGVRPGTRMVVGRHRKAPFRMGDHVASYALDNRASLAILLELARRLRKPAPRICLVASAKEEVGAVGALYFTRQRSVDALIALEVCPIAPEYAVVDGAAPVLLAQDSHGLYDSALNARIRAAAARRGIPLQMAVLNGFGSDGSIAMQSGHVPRAACLGFPTQNTHGYEIAGLAAIGNCVDILDSVCAERVV